MMSFHSYELIALEQRHQHRAGVHDERIKIAADVVPD
jgi:hypothetical protein